MVLKNLQGSRGETDIENRLMDMGKGEERVRRIERVTWKLILPYVKGSPPGSLVPGILQTRILEWVAISFSNS